MSLALHGARSLCLRSECDCNTALTSNCALRAGPAGQRTRLVCVPSFAATGTLVLVNLRTLACHPISFDTNFDE